MRLTSTRIPRAYLAPRNQWFGGGRESGVLTAAPLPKLGPHTQAKAKVTGS